ncbi:ribonuclease P protein subunit p21-like [Myxocyprinus asiaticus]|uniref:ribonuclease P protein subunit p21-like n=1 Tax=Myxocyprinus asiaticus TaxID=70543 RepID=UPI002223D67D|nr:ribonuclease P protein subunit p21-like [Myxocyprinus asiaticus]
MAGNVKDKEAFQRLNFLYQAAHCVLAQNPENIELARFYCFTQKTISKRLVLRQDHSVKRTICKKCCTLLVPGVTSSVRQKRGPRPQRRTIVRCLSCGLTKRFPNNPKHKLWVDQPEAQLENQTPPDAGPSSKSTIQKKKSDISSGPAPTSQKTLSSDQKNQTCEN